MTRRTAQAAAAASASAAARATTASSSTPAPTLPVPTALPPDAPFAAEYSALRRHWKWANFSQFFFTFNALFNMPDVSLADVEDDLARSSAIVLPRIMHRLLIVLTQDRKLSLDNWQNSLRKQYARRDPDKNPIGPIPPKATRSPSPEPLTNGDAEPSGEHDDDVDATGLAEHSADAATATESVPGPSAPPSPPKEELPTDEQTEQAPLEESKDWMELPMLAKLDSMHLLTEWQFQNVTRFRQTMKSDDENASWRTEPIGYDAKSNAYWIIGLDRLWIQRMPPKPPRSLKRKRSSPKKKRAPSPPPDEDFAEPEPEPAPTAKRARTARGKASSSATNDKDDTSASTGGGRGSRAAKLQANKKLDQQQKELAELKRQAAAEQRMSMSMSKARARPTGGTRVSRRLRGTDEDLEWQEIPEEWLRDDQQIEAGVEVKKDDEEAKEESDAGSALTELSESEDEGVPATIANGHAKGKGKSKSSKAKSKVKVKVKVKEPSPEPEHEPEPEPEPWQPPEDWVEWETLCVTLYDWEHIAERFEKATHYAEKALYKVLTQVYVPEITAELREIDRLRRAEEAVNQRKRSSRLALKDQEREEQRQAELRRHEDEEKMGRARRAEARMKREEEERLKHENAREQRRREREEREARRRALVEAGAQARERGESERADTPVDVVSDDQPVPALPAAQPKTPRKRQRTSEKDKATNGGSSTASKPAAKRSGRKRGVGAGDDAEDWELDCEICGKRGVNLDDETGLVSCGRCGKWQHIKCHDTADKRAGRPKRDWEKEEFMCSRCRAYVPVPMSKPAQGTTSYGAGSVGVQAYGSGTQTYGASPQAYGYGNSQGYGGYGSGSGSQAYSQAPYGGVYGSSTPSKSIYANGAQNGQSHAAPAPSGWPGQSPAYMSASPSQPAYGSSTHSAYVGYPQPLPPAAGHHPGISTSSHFNAPPANPHPSLPPMPVNANGSHNLPPLATTVPLNHHHPLPSNSLPAHSTINSSASPFPTATGSSPRQTFSHSPRSTNPLPSISPIRTDTSPHLPHAASSSPKPTLPSVNGFLTGAPPVGQPYLQGYSPSSYGRDSRTG